MQSPSQALGVLGEELAFHYLRKSGYKVLLRNYESPMGEIDLIAKEKGSLVFVEVKTRSNDAMGDPAEAVTRFKRHQIVKSAQYYVKRYGIHEIPCRFDVVCVQMTPDKEPEIRLIENAFGVGD